LFELAINLEWATTNPAALSEKVKAPICGYHAVIIRGTTARPNNFGLA
jgi:hypothetical protein